MLTFYAIIQGNYRWLNVAVFLNRPLPQLKHPYLAAAPVYFEFPPGESKSKAPLPPSASVLNGKRV